MSLIVLKTAFGYNNDFCSKIYIFYQNRFFRTEFDITRRICAREHNYNCDLFCSLAIIVSSNSDLKILF